MFFLKIESIYGHEGPSLTSQQILCCHMFMFRQTMHRSILNDSLFQPPAWMKSYAEPIGFCSQRGFWLHLFLKKALLEKGMYQCRLTLDYGVLPPQHLMLRFLFGSADRYLTLLVSQTLHLQVENLLRNGYCEREREIIVLNTALP